MMDFSDACPEVRLQEHLHTARSVVARPLPLT